jgi:hypothetical protein
MNSRSVIFKILGIIVCLVFVVTGIFDHRSQVRLKKMGHVAVLDRVQEYTDRSQKGMHTYTAELSFKTEAGNQVRFKHSFPESALDDFKAGVPVSVYYDPNDPSEISFAKESANWWMTIGGVVGIIAVVLFV